MHQCLLPSLGTEAHMEGRVSPAPDSEEMGFCVGGTLIFLTKLQILRRISLDWEYDSVVLELTSEDWAWW